MSLNINGKISRDNFSFELDLTLPENAIIGVLGSSGCGKSSLIRSLAGLDRQAKLCITQNDSKWQDEQSFSSPEERPLAYLSQKPALFPHLTVAKNLDFAFQRAKGDYPDFSLDQIIDDCGIRPWLKRLPSQLSGGQAQRVALARAIASQAPLILLDEAFSALDQNGRQELLAHLRSWQKTWSLQIILVSHQVEDLAQVADTCLYFPKNNTAAILEPIAQLLTRLDLDLAHDHKAMSLLRGRFVELDERYGLSRLSFGDNSLYLTKTGLQLGQEYQAKIHAQDISISLQAHSESSILNHFPVTIVKIEEKDTTAQCLLLVKTNDEQELLVRISKKSLHDLKIAVGDHVFAQVKSVALF